MKLGAHLIVSPRDPQSGLPTGQRMHKPFKSGPTATPTPAPSAASEKARPGRIKTAHVTIKREFSGKDSFASAPSSAKVRDVATGQASGKRQHGTISVTKEWGTTTPSVLKEW